MTPSALVEVGLPALAKRIGALHNMTNADNRHDLLEAGRRFAQRQVQPEHFPHGFDLATPRGASES
jgi:hypothetical protein